MGVVTFFTKWLLCVEVHSLWTPPYRASCLHSCPGRLPAPTCRNSAPGWPNANTPASCWAEPLCSGCRQLVDMEARTSLHAPWLPVQAAPGHHATSLGWATAGLPGSPLLGCSPVCALAAAQLLLAASALTLRVLSPALGSARDGEEGTACPTGHCSTEHQLTPDLPEPRTLLPGPGKLSPPPGGPVP